MSKHKAYPAQTGMYKVQVKNKATWQEHNAVCFSISVGKPHHEGEKFKATCAWAADRFDHVTLAVADTLQRHNDMFELGLTEEEAHDKWLHEGHKWIQRNIEYLEPLKSYSIDRWDDYLTDQGFKEKHDFVWDYYRSNLEYQKVIDDMIATIWDRSYAGRTDVAFRRQEFFKYSRNFLLEEMAIFANQADKKNIHRVYPGSFLDLAKFFIPNLSYTRIDFKRNR